VPSLPRFIPPPGMTAAVRLLVQWIISFVLILLLGIMVALCEPRVARAAPIPQQRRLLPLVRLLRGD